MYIDYNLQFKLLKSVWTKLRFLTFCTLRFGHQQESTIWDLWSNSFYEHDFLCIYVFYVFIGKCLT